MVIYFLLLSKKIEYLQSRCTFQLNLIVIDLFFNHYYYYYFLLSIGSHICCQSDPHPLSLPASGVKRYPKMYLRAPLIRTRQSYAGSEPNKFGNARHLSANGRRDMGQCGPQVRKLFVGHCDICTGRSSSSYSLIKSGTHLDHEST